ncbi:50S ribosomal protein L3 [Candidatus Sumerlaeota bacterium]|nr:50S ribosomal protein L3 [Candidatus Sumerlaeota bacterium]
MAIGLLGKKLGMSQIYDENGTAVPVTLILAGPCPILQKRVPDKDGYSALQLGFESRAGRTIAKPMLGHFKKAGVDPVRFVREIRLNDCNGFEVGQTLKVDLFAVGDRVDVCGVSKGRGFSGTIRRFHTARGPMSHGSTYHRRPGSSGASADPSRTYKGKVSPGRHGAVRRTAQNLQVVGTDLERNLLIVKGSIPGAANGYVVVSKSVKTSTKTHGGPTAGK